MANEKNEEFAELAGRMMEALNGPKFNNVRHEAIDIINDPKLIRLGVFGWTSDGQFHQACILDDNCLAWLSIILAKKVRGI